jgi:coproporphyrinogen III oxidase-like Fe-S oxidoreductase
MREELLLGLRSRGVNVSEFRKRHGRDLLHEGNSRISKFLDSRLLIVERDTLRLSRKGILLCDEIACALAG